jgi:hypothetical protein
MKPTSNRHRWNGDNYIDTHDTRIVNGAVRVKTEKVPNPRALHLLWVALCWMTLTTTGLASAQGSADEPTEIRNILQQAREAAAGISENCTLTTKIAEAQVKAGEVEGAMQTAVGIQNDWCKRTVFMRVNEILGDAQKALQIAAGNPDNRAKNYVLLAIAESQTKAGDLQGAMQTAGGIRDDSVKSSVLMSVARAQFKTGNVQEGAGNGCGHPIP